MTTTEVSQAQRDDAPQARGRRRLWWLLGGIGLAGAMFAGGFLLAGRVASTGPDPLSNAAEGLALQQLVLLSQQADGVIKQVPESGGDPDAVLALAVKLQGIAVSMSDLAAEAPAGQLKELTNDLADAYLAIGVGLAVNSSARVNDGVTALKESQQAFSDYLGVARPEQPADKQPQAPAEGDRGQ